MVSVMLGFMRIEPLSRRAEHRSRYCVLVALIATALLAAGCAGSRGGHGGDLYGPGPRGYMVGKPYRVNGVWYVPTEDRGYDRVGLASWYGPGFNGSRTANGERYDRRRMTAAHPTLPMPVLVRVTNLENGRSTVLRVNDRGPFIPGRIIDVSEAAAKALGFRNNGLARVRVQYVSRADGRAVAKRETSSPDTVPAPMASADEPSSAISSMPVKAAMTMPMPAESPPPSDASALADIRP